jgi:hypothetical protein
MGNLDASIGRVRKPYAYLQTSFNERMPAFSPDGRWLAYASDESGRFEVYVQRFPGPGEKMMVSTGGSASATTRHVCSRQGTGCLLICQPGSNASGLVPINALVVIDSPTPGLSACRK